MSKHCKGFCELMPHFWRYVDGYKYCKACETFLQTEIGTNNICPCCHNQMRDKPRVADKAKRLARSEAMIRI